MKILVTGGNGFLGSAVVKLLLSDGHEVGSLQRSAPRSAPDGLTTFQGDLSDQHSVMQAVKDCEAVIHTAAKAGIWGSRDSFWKPNVNGTRLLLEASKKAGVRFFVHTSTPSVVFSGESFEGQGEELPYGRNWTSHYAESKAMAEAEVLTAHVSGRFETCALRPHLIWGPGDPHLLPRVIRRARAGRLRIVGEGHNRVDITYIEHAAAAHLLALAALREGRAGGKAYFISDGQPVKLWPWINQLLEGLGEKPLTRRLSAAKAFRIGTACEFLWKNLPLPGEPPMTRFVATELAKSHWFSIEAARRDLRYGPHVPMEEGLRQFIDWWKAQV